MIIGGPDNINILDPEVSINFLTKRNSLQILTFFFPNPLICSNDVAVKKHACQLKRMYYIDISLDFCFLFSVKNL